MKFQSDRRFQIWDYNVSHARLLIRSPASSNIPTNIDIIFFGVRYVGIPAYLQGLKIELASEKDIDHSSIPREEHDQSTGFRMETAGRSFFLQAYACRVLENHLDLFDSSLENPSNDRPREDLGRVLAHS
jgi:hypothetical protein